MKDTFHHTALQELNQTQMKMRKKNPKVLPFMSKLPFKCQLSNISLFSNMKIVKNQIKQS